METKKWMASLHPDSPVREYLRWMGQGGNEVLYNAQYAPLAAANAEQPRHPFLTVVIRTQGTRPEMLQDVLTCLQAQRDEDFEVILICHRGKPEAVRAMEELIAAQAPGFASRVRVTASDRGERGAPLNLGFAMARGDYAVCLDDDDLVLDHWTESFHTAAKEHAGMILHAWALTQPWKATSGPDGKQRLRAAGSPEGRYCVPYRTLTQQAENYCPFMGLAFPLFLFREAHILFSEELTTTEDWDYLLRTAGIAGVYDLEEITAIYRLWNTKDASRKKVQEPEWKANYRSIHMNQRQAPLLLTAAEAEVCREELTGLQSAGQKGRSCFLREAVLFWSGEEEFSDKRHMVTKIAMNKGWLRAEFPLGDKMREAGDSRPITRLRIDPAEEALFALEQIRVRLYDGETQIGELGPEQIRETNGLQEGGQILFLADDPRIILKAEEPIPPCTIVFTARVVYRSPRVMTRWAEDLCADARWLADNRDIAHLYPDRGAGILPEEVLTCRGVLGQEGYRAVFDIPAAPDGAEPIRAMRFDPTEAEMFAVDELRISLTGADGREATLGADDIGWLNGFITGDGAAFIARDPIMSFAVPDGMELRQVTITGKAAFLTAEEMEDRFAAARRVPDYGMTIAQLQTMRRDKWKEDLARDEEAEDDE